MGNLFAIIAMRSTSSTGTDTTIYASSEGGYRTVGSTVTWFPARARYGSITVAADTPAGSVQAPGTLSITLDNADGWLDAYLPGGATEQYWPGSTVTVYSGGADGDNVTTTITEFIGYITPGSVRIEPGSSALSFVVQDKRAIDNAQIAKQTWSDHAQYSAGTAEEGIAGETIPVIIGDWTVGSPKLPAVKLAVSGANYTYGICNHAIGTVTVYWRQDRNEAWTNVTAACTVTAATGYFVAATGHAAFGGTFDADKAVFTVTCVGYPAVFTDGNPVLVIQKILTQFAGVTAGSGAGTDIYYPLSGAFVGARGGFRDAYADLGSATPDYGARAYVDSAETRVLELIGRIAFESALIVGHDGGKYRIYSTLPVAAARASTFYAHDVVSGQIGSDLDPDSTYANVARVRYNISPADGNKALAYYDTKASVSSGPIYDATQAYGRDVEYADTFIHVYGTGTPTAIQRALLWRIGRAEIVTASVFGETGSVAWAHGLGADAMFEVGRYDGVDVRALKIVKNARTATVQFVGLALHGLLTGGVWADSSGNDAEGNPVTTSIWADASETDGSGNAVTSMWI